MTRQRRIKARLQVLAVTVGLLGLAVPAMAQNAVPGGAAAPEKVVDFREAMRTLVQNLSTYARSLKPGFIVVAENGLDLATKPDFQDNTLLFPARTFTRAIDGTLEPDLLKKLTPPSVKEAAKESPALSAARAILSTNVETANSLGLTIFDLEFATKPQDIDRAYAQAHAKKFVPFVADNPILGRVPPYPKLAYNANPKSLDDLKQATNFIYIANAQGFGSTNDFVQALSYTNHDIVITNVFHGRTPLSKLDVERLKYKKLGARRLVLAEVDVSTVATYNFLWQPNWGMNDPAFVNVPLRDDPDRYRITYWDPAWHSLLYGGTASYLYGVMDLGFDGVVLKGVDGWRYFETGGEENQ